MAFLSAALVIAVYITCSIAANTNMNIGGVPYGISNPPGSTKNWNGTNGTYSTQFQSNIDGTVEHFDVYGEVRTNYSQVYWTRNLPINLPPQIIERFKDKVMVITGYEVDQVTHNGPENGSTTTDTQLGGFSCYPSCDSNGEDKSVPIYNAYNHHYFAWLVSSDAEMYERETPLQIPNPTNTAFKAKSGAANNITYPLSIVYKENPGGEFRKSYHGYPNGYGQFIYSPSQWVVEPMQIDTHNRNYDINDHSHGYIPYILPKQDTANNMTDLGNKMSPLIECPCTDRITKTKIETPIILTNGSCGTKIITSKDECVNTSMAINDMVISSIKSINDPSQIAGCSIKPDGNDGYTVMFNSDTTQQKCGPDIVVGMIGNANLGNLTTLKLQHNGEGNVTITMSGPSKVWYGVGFDATTMADEPYAIIVDGTGAVTERKLGNHNPGTLLPSTITVLSDSVNGDIRTVVMERPLKGMEYCLTQSGSLNVITAIGSTPQLSYHAARTAANIILLPITSDACICEANIQSYITYMNTETNGFGYDCIGEPRSDMKNKGDGTGREGISNAACDVDTYHGGLQCCKHKFYLTDKDQESLIPKNKTDKYFLKWRYYFQEYIPPNKTTKQAASHKHLHHWVFLIDDAVNDYEEDNLESEYGIQETVGKITANLTVRYMGLEDISGSYNDNGGIAPVPFYPNTTIQPMVMTPHCHAPSCIREELWNADTGEILCNMTAKYGDEKYGSLYDIFNEPNYITIIPCIYGYQQGLQYPFVLKQGTNLTAIKYFNNTWRHLGQMAQWTGLMVYNTDPY